MSEVRAMLAFAIEKAPDGGYAAKEISVKDGKVVEMRTIKFANDQCEIWRRLHQLGEQAFEDTAWVDRVIERQVIVQHVRPEIPTVQPTQQPPPMSDMTGYEPMPNVVDRMREDPPHPPQHSAIEKARDAIRGLGRNGGSHALVFGLLCALSLKLGNLA